MEVSILSFIWYSFIAPFIAPVWFIAWSSLKDRRYLLLQLYGFMGSNIRLMDGNEKENRRKFNKKSLAIFGKIDDLEYGTEAYEWGVWYRSKYFSYRHNIYLLFHKSYFYKEISKDLHMILTSCSTNEKNILDMNDLIDKFKPGGYYYTLSGPYYYLI